MIDEYANRAEPLPVLMDDVMVNFDAERTAAACEATLSLADTHQVFFLTADQRTADMFVEPGQINGHVGPSKISL
jgi:uncharacterized protein YhaN